MNAMSLILIHKIRHEIVNHMLSFGYGIPQVEIDSVHFLPAGHASTVGPASRVLEIRMSLHILHTRPMDATKEHTHTRISTAYARTALSKRRVGSTRGLLTLIH